MFWFFSKGFEPGSTCNRVPLEEMHLNRAGPSLWMLLGVPIQMASTASQRGSLNTFCWGQTWTPSTTISVCTWFHPGRILNIKWQAKVIRQEVLEGHPPTHWGSSYCNKNAPSRKGSQLHKKPAVRWKLRRGGCRRKRPEIQVKPQQPENLSVLTWRWLCPKRTCQHGLKWCQMSQHDCARIRMAGRANQSFNPNSLRHSRWWLEMFFVLGRGGISISVLTFSLATHLNRQSITYC